MQPRRAVFICVRMISIRLVCSRGERKEDPIFQKSSPADKEAWISFRIKHQLVLLSQDGWWSVWCIKWAISLSFNNYATLFFVAAAFDWGRLGGKVEDESLGSHETSM